MSITVNETLFSKVEAALDRIRPFLHEDGGDVVLVEVTESMVAKVTFTGACKSCSMSTMTFQNGVETEILRAVPEIRKVEIIEVD